MVTAVLAITAGSLVCWPSHPPAHRLRLLTPAQHPIRIRPRTAAALMRHGPLALIGIATLLAALCVGSGVGFAIGISGITARALWRSHRKLAGELAAAEALTDAIHGLVAELRSGAHPVVAAESAAKDAKEPARAVLTAISAAARLGGDLTTALRQFDNSTLAPVLRPLTHAWSLAQRHGLPLADVLDSVRRDVAGRVRFANRVRARMAGPKASGTVLAVLPAVGLLLGESMGASPVHVLFTSSLGQTLLALGTTLICAGLYWITRLTSKAAL
ncbi:MAG TPA: type II secretion system F family protein [Pseudonocardiaceae bacterium]|nr:type II secretion system F family protein [Pseudonocardiaceae bacterium]